MIHQCYIKCNDYYLFACVSIPEHYASAVILLQGYSHAMTDIDYFMTNIRNQLIKQNILVIQFDPYGHGDSDGYIEKFDINILKENIKSVYSWAMIQFAVEIKIFTRGLYEIIFKESDISNLFKYMVALNPVSINSCEFEKITKYSTIKNNNPIIDFNKWYKNIDENNQDFIESLFYTFGAKLKNLQGQFINLSIFNDFINKITIKRSTNTNNISYIVSNQSDNILCDYKYIEHDLNWFYKYNALPRDPEWHYNIINKISELLKEN